MSSESKPTLSTKTFSWYAGWCVMAAAILLSVLVSLCRLTETQTLITGLSTGLVTISASAIMLYRKEGKKTMLYILLALAAWLFQVMNGAFIITAFLRLFTNCLVYFLSGIWILHSSKGSIRFAELFLLLLAAPTLFFFPFGNNFGDKEFYPLTYSPFLSLSFLYLYYRSGQKWKVSVAAVLVFSLLSFVAYPNYWASLSGKEIEHPKADQRALLQVTDATGDRHSVQEIEDRVVILDVWYSKCAACFRGFPKLEGLYTEYSRDSSIYIASLNIPLDEELNTSEAFDALKKYRFHQLKAMESITANTWNINRYPTILVFDKQKRLRYQGALQTDKAIVVNNIHRLIERLKKE
ncbi:MAG TPA: hypothetical protein VL092_09335 [Chitinophagaceae bacterium]|nr:hypothetical protein [Chitinophagaceae bacterium]